jgi:unsaturated rhamnogalacturonyl hydrolase
MISLIETLEYLPVNHPDRALLISVFQRVFKSVVKYQDKKTGMWYQVTNLKRQKSNFLESSSTAMFSYIIAKAINKGYLENKYQKNAEKAFDGILKNSTEENADGSISFINSSARASLGGNPYADGTFNYYVALPRLKDDPKLLAYMIMACLELEKFE